MKQRTINEKIILIISIFIAGLCSIIYELLISTTSSYFLGDSIKQFSITIGVYMAAMGLGSFLSRLFQKKLLLRFIEVELLLGLVGGCSVPILYFTFANTSYGSFSFVMILLISLIGMFTGLEIPLLTQIMKKYYPLNVNLSNVLSLDYLGALAATLLFPFFLLPWIGVFQSSIIFGLVNVGLGGLNLWYFRNHLSKAERRKYGLLTGTIILAFIALLVYSNQLLAHWHDSLYRDHIVYSQQSSYQHIVLTKGKDDVRLYLDRVIQFSSTDEYRYHESLVHPLLSLARHRSKVLILGGGEGLAAREVFKFEGVDELTVVDIDPAIFELGKENPHLRKLNEDVLYHDRIRLKPEDAFVFLQQNRDLYDVIIADLPDPTTEALTRLYSREFYKLIHQRLAKEGVFVTQASSPFHTTDAFWCIKSSVEAGGFNFIYPYHNYVPSFGDWGFILAANYPLPIQNIEIEKPTRYLDSTIVQRSFIFEKDLLPKDSIQFTTLDHPVLLDYYLDGWLRWSREKVIN